MVGLFITGTSWKMNWLFHKKYRQYTPRFKGIPHLHILPRRLLCGDPYLTLNKPCLKGGKLPILWQGWPSLPSSEAQCSFEGGKRRLPQRAINSAVNQLCWWCLGCSGGPTKIQGRQRPSGCKIWPENSPFLWGLWGSCLFGPFWPQCGLSGSCMVRTSMPCKIPQMLRLFCFLGIGNAL